MGDDDLLEKLAIQELIYRYTDALNREDWDAFEATFAPEGTWEIGAPAPLRAEGAANVRAAISERVTPLELLNQIAMVPVVDVDGDTATARVVIEEWARLPDVFSMRLRGIYYDELRKVDGQWRFTSRLMRTVYVDHSPLEGRVLVTRDELP
jgi:ketosteroid isomerase-like protein